MESATPPPPSPPLAAYDRQLADRRERNPRWRIWYVPHAVGGATWCAQPLPLLNCASPAELDKAIAETEQEWAERP